MRGDGSGASARQTAEARIATLPAEVDVQDRIETIALRGAAAVLRRVPAGMARSAARGLGRVAWRLGARRRVTLANITAAFPDKTATACDAIGRAAMQALVETATEFLRLPPRVLRPGEAPVQFVGWEHLEAARHAGRGAIVASAHLGNWELYGAATVPRGLDATLIVQPLRNRILDAELCQRRRRFGLNVVERGMGMRSVGDLLQANHVIAMMCDQDARQRGIFVDFFGRPASTHKGAAQLAFRHAVPLIPFLGVRRPDGTHLVTVLPPLQAPPGAGEEEFIQHTMQAFHVHLEERIRAHPEQYLWQHRRWKTQPEEHRAAETRGSPAVSP